MNIRRFFGKNSREALSMVRKALGDDAVILANRIVNGGNEIMALKEEDMNAMVARETGRDHAPSAHPPQIPAQSHESQSHDSNEPTTLLSLLNKNNRVQAEDTHTAKAAPAAPVVNKPAAVSKPTAVSNPASSPAVQQMAYVLSEMRNMRSAFESQLTTIAWGNIQQRDPIKSKVLSTLLATGFSASLSRQLAENLPANMNAEQAVAWIKTVLANNLNTIENDTEMLSKGGIFALIGPTGVGKTTTTAKLAARYVMKHGTQNLGLITTDAYRIGGHEQLRIYGKILGVMVHAVKDEADLKIALNELRHKPTILIDTVGVGQRDSMVAEQIAMLSNTNIPVKRLLCLNATSTGETLSDVVKAYKGKGLDGCIITKIDEAATIGNVLDVIVKEKLKLFYATNGQRVPEDIHQANKQQLIQHALKLSSASNKSFQFLNEELPFVMGNTAQAANSSKAAEIRYV